jgi:hypothetical protein
VRGVLGASGRAGALATPPRRYRDGMADDDRPLINVDTYFRLVEAGIVGEKIELIEGRLVFGDFELAFSPAQRAAAAELGIDLPENQQAPR